MRYAPEHKARTRTRILDRAALLFRREGFAGVGIDRIMEAAGLTRGGFYAHFRSKEELFAQVLDREGDLARRLRESPDAARVLSGYLDPENRDQIARGCSLATLTGEVPRRGRAARRAYTRQVEQLLEELEAHVPAGARDSRSRALEALALCVGGIGLARAMGDGELSRELLARCRDAACAALEGGAA